MDTETRTDACPICADSLSALPLDHEECVGRRVRLRKPVDRHDFVADAYAMGVISCIDDSGIRVRMDRHIEGAEEWDNEIHWYEIDDTILDVGQDLEAV